MFKGIIIGRLTRDATLNEVNGRQVCNFDVAVRTDFKDASGQYITNFVKVAAWNGQAGPCSHLTKGQMVAVTGSIVEKDYKKRDGTDGHETNITASGVEFLTPKKDNGGADLFEGN
ncbi:MAG: single-stranded DNA-binding protein [Exiguobacterium sp.]|nr:single-stranded DNA-binding protein [Exiguobacterium sp.]